jgi:hypothetical protein
VDFNGKTPLKSMVKERGYGEGSSEKCVDHKPENRSPNAIKESRAQDYPEYIT